MLGQGKMFPTELHACFIIEQGKTHARDYLQEKRGELDRIAELLQNLQVYAPAGRDTDEKLNGIECGAVERWIEVQEDREVKEALVNDVFERLEDDSITKSGISPNAEICEVLAARKTKSKNTFSC